MKKVYIVEEMTELEYGGTDIVAVFDTEDKAKKFVEENQEMVSVWWADEDIESFSYREWGVE